ncbi:MAG: hypothetical protein ABH859_08715 [Pseudomonadota bacterium]
MQKIMISVCLLACFFLLACPNSTTTTSSGGTTGTGTTATGQATREAPIVADHTAVAGFNAGIPESAVTTAKANLNIFYGHTSHGSQLMTGMTMLGAPYYSAGSKLNITENRDVDLGHSGDTSWADTTRTALDNNANLNVVIWSWCGGVADNTTEGINTYLTTMDQLEQEYPEVTFVYMTGRHWNFDNEARVEGESSSTNTHIQEMNTLIRNYANTYNKVLFDFADIEEYDPDGTQYTNTSDHCDWCETWCANNGNPGYCNTCDAGDSFDPFGYGCAHSQCLNCYQKGKAFWWLMARIAGWEG